MVRRLLAFAAVACGIAVTDAACHNNCHGHGTCGAFDKCLCWADFAHETDCSLRTCQFARTRGKVSASSSNIDFDVHGYEECAGQGVCNRKTGECECNDGFTGAACQRTACVNDCSGHGECASVKAFNPGYTTSSWDAELTNVCKCDAGWEGASCDARMCPRGDDPLTPGTGSAVDEIQECKITASGGNINGGEFSVVFTDWAGQKHESRPISATAATAQQIKEELQRIPNNKIQTIETSVAGLGTATVTFKVTFTGEEVSGSNGLLEVEIDDDSATGHKHIRNPVVSSDGSATFTAVCTKPTASTEEANVCSGRGVCDGTTGLCQCHRGFKGHKCHHQTYLV